MTNTYKQMVDEHKHINTTKAMREAAVSYLATLSSEQKSKSTFEYMDGERQFWYYPPMNRHGLALRDMDITQRKAAMNLAEASLSPVAYEYMQQIIDHEAILGPIEKSKGIISFVRDCELYYFTIFGDPLTNDEPWGWRVEGHHISFHFSIWGDTVISTTPFFLGANPAEVKEGDSKGLRILKKREDLGLELFNSLDNDQQTIAKIADEPPFDILTYNSTKAVLMQEEGISGKEMSGVQKEILLSLLDEYHSVFPQDIYQEKIDNIQSKGLDDMYFVWAGGNKLGQQHYYRIHCGNLFIEYDNRQNDANHTHSVLRDVENDFAENILRQHQLLFKVL